VTNTDNDVAGITVSPTSGLVTTEAGGSDTFTIVLTSEPTADVSINLSSSDTTEGSVSPASVTFTPANWNTPQTVTVTGANDFVVDGNVAYTIVTDPATSTDPNYNGVDASDVSVTNTDDDVASITVNPTTGLVTTENGGTATFTIVLTSQPTADVTIDLTSSNLNEGTVSPASVTFTNITWSIPQTITVTGVDDFIIDGNIAYTIITTDTVSTDPNYSGRIVSDVSVTNTDNDTAGITVSPTSGLVTTESGGTATFTIVLNTQPAADVTIGLSSSNLAEGTVAPASVTFTPGSWNTFQIITVTGVNDAVVDGNIAYTIVTAPATSADPSYNGLDAADVSVTNDDNDVPYSPGGGGGGGGGSNEASPTTTNLLDVDMLGSDNRVQVTNDGIVVEASTVVSLNNEVSLKLARGAKLTSANNNVPSGLALMVANETPPIPAGMVLVSQVYDCVAYSLGKGELSVNFDPPATLVINYNPEAVHGTNASIFIAYYDEKLGWVRLAAPSDFVAEAGTAAAEVSHFTPFAVLAELVPPPPAVFEVSNLDISPSQVVTGEDVNISAQVANTGGVSGEYTLMVNVDGLLETSQVIALAPGQSQELSFDLTPDTPGSYQVEIGGLQGNFVVVAPSPPPTTPAAKTGGFKWSTPWLIAIIAATVLAVLLATLVRKRPQPVPVARTPLPPKPKPTPTPSRFGKAMAAIAGAASTLVRKRPRPAAIRPAVISEAPSKPAPTAAEEPRKPAPVLSPVRDLRIIPNRIKPGGTIYIFAEATNNNPTTSSFSLVLKVRGVVEAVKELTLGPGQSQKVAFIVLRDKPGVYDVDLEGLKGSFVVEEPPDPIQTVVKKPSEPAPTVVEKPSEPAPTAVEKPSEPAPAPSPVKNLEIIPNRVKPRKIINVFAEVTNNHPTTSGFSLILKVKGAVEAVKELTLSPWQSQKVAFTVLRDKPGVYDVELEGLKGSFTVEK
jgi:hypothetical protein